MENSAAFKYTKVVHHFQISYSEMKDLQPNQFVSSPVFRALGEEWLIVCCLPRCSQERSICCFPQCSSAIHISFLVRLHREYKTVNPTISLSLMKRDGTTETLPFRYLHGNGAGILLSTVPRSPFEGQVFNFSASCNSELEKYLVNDGSFELICTINNTYMPHNRYSVGLPQSSDLHYQIGKLLKCSETTDVTFHVENRSFMCHKLILAARSPVFKAELFGNMAEATEKCIKIEDMSPEVFEAMLRFIYTDSFPYFDSEKPSTIMAQHLFVAADRYAIDGLKVLCEDQLCAHISLDTVTANLALALQHSSRRLKIACLDFIAEPGTLVNWMLSDQYEDLVRSFPSIKAEIRGKVDTLPSFSNVKK